METSQPFWQAALLLERHPGENSFPYTQYESLLYSLCLLSLILPLISAKNLALPFRAFTVTGPFLPRWRVCIDPYWISYCSCWPLSLSRCLWLAGLPSSYRQTAPGNWCHLKSMLHPLLQVTGKGHKQDRSQQMLKYCSCYVYECAWDQWAKLSSSSDSLSICWVLCPSRMYCPTLHRGLSRRLMKALLKSR